MYIYTCYSGKHVATVKGTWRDDRQAVDAGVAANYSTNDYGYTLVMDLPGGKNPNAEIIEIDA